MASVRSFHAPKRKPSMQISLGTKNAALATTAAVNAGSCYLPICEMSALRRIYMQVHSKHKVALPLLNLAVPQSQVINNTLYHNITLATLVHCS